MLDDHLTMTLKCHSVMSREKTPHAPTNRVQMFTGWDAHSRAKNLAYRLIRQVPKMEFWVENPTSPPNGG